MRQGALPTTELILLDLVAPPVIAGLWWIMSRSWGGIVQGGSTSKETRIRQFQGFWALLIFLYLMAVGTTLYAWLT